MCQKGEQEVLDLPDNIDSGEENRTISADKCCVAVLKHLWVNGLETLSHCCGHGEQNPSIVIPSEYHRIAIARMEILIEQVDSRQWDIFQWQLIKTNQYKWWAQVERWFKRLVR